MQFAKVDIFKAIMILLSMHSAHQTFGPGDIIHDLCLLVVCNEMHWYASVRGADLACSQDGQRQYVLSSFDLLALLLSLLCLTDT